MLLGLALRFGATLHDILSRLPAGGMVWVVLFVGGFCCTGLYLFETMLGPAAEEPARACPACHQKLHPPFYSQSICPACGKVITVPDPSVQPAPGTPRISRSSRMAPNKSFWGSRQSVLLILPLYLFLMALAVYLAEHPLILWQWVDIVERALRR